MKKAYIISSIFAIFFAFMALVTPHKSEASWNVSVSVGGGYNSGYNNYGGYGYYPYYGYTSGYYGYTSGYYYPNYYNSYYYTPYQAYPNYGYNSWTYTPYYGNCYTYCY